MIVKQAKATRKARKGKAEEMGQVLVRLILENPYDLYEVEQGRREGSAVRRVVAEEALADSGSSTLMLPTRYRKKLGLKRGRPLQGITTAGITTFYRCGPVKITVQGRDATLDAVEIPDSNSRVLLGQIPLEAMDLAIDLRRRLLIPNPAHGGEWTVET